MINCGIYKITNTINNKIYIGSSIRIHKRLVEHVNKLKNNKHRNPHLQNTWNKYGNVFIFEILLYCDEENLAIYEQRAIDEYQSFDVKFGYNIMPVQRGNLNSNNYKERNKKISETHIRKGISKGKNNPMFGKTGEKNHWYGMTGEKNPFYKVPRSEEVKKLMSKNRKGKGSFKGALNSNAKSCKIFEKCYGTIKEAAQILGINAATISARIKINKPGYYLV